MFVTQTPQETENRPHRTYRDPTNPAQRTKGRLMARKMVVMQRTYVEAQLTSRAGWANMCHSLPAAGRQPAALCACLETNQDSNQN